MQRGELVQWNDSRGFGFILANDGKRYFVHISNIGRIATRPRAGDLVSFTPAKGGDGRSEARSVAILGANPKPSAAQTRRGTSSPVRFGWRLALAGLLAVLIAVGLLFGRFPLLLGAFYAIMGLVSFLAYGRDKRFAESGQWRISEATLLALDLCFGVLGGLLGQEVFRHKTRKSGYVATTGLIAGVHLLWISGLSLGFIPPDALGEIFADLQGVLA